MTTLGISGNSEEISKLIEIDGIERNNGIEAKMDLDAIFDHLNRRHFKSKTGVEPADDWDWREEPAEEGWEEEDISEIPRI